MSWWRCQSYITLYITIIIMMNIFALINFAACKNHWETRRVSNDKPRLLLKTIDAKSSSLKLMAASAEPCSSLLTLAARSSAELTTK